MGPSPTSRSSWRARDPSEKSRQKNGAFKKFEERPDILASNAFWPELMNAPIARPRWPSPRVATTLRKSHGLTQLVGAVVGAQEVLLSRVRNLSTESDQAQSADSTERVRPTGGAGQVSRARVDKANRTAATVWKTSRIARGVPSGANVNDLAPDAILARHSLGGRRRGATTSSYNVRN
jgi:hypothetical protein